MPNILVTNDDGISAPGLRALAQGLANIGSVTVVAPSSERSAAAQSLTLRKPIFCEQIADREWAVDGTPADAMILAFHSLLPQRPDLVVSGINPGGNLGENVYYSGTIGAAMEKDFRLPASGSLPRTPRAAHFEGRFAAGRFTERQHPASVEKRCALHASVTENHAQRSRTS